MNKQYISEAFDTLHKMESKKKTSKKVIKEGTSQSIPNRRKLNESNKYQDFDTFYDAVWQKMLDNGVEVVDDAIQGRMGTTWLRWNEDSEVVKLDETEAQDVVEKIFNTTQSIDDAIEALGDACTPSTEFNDDDKENGEEESILDNSISSDDFSNWENWTRKDLIPYKSWEFEELQKLETRADRMTATPKQILGIVSTYLKHQDADIKDVLRHLEFLKYHVDLSDPKHPKMTSRHWDDKTFEFSL